ncbi:MAG TPA: hypothetical protein VL286_04405 [Rhizomicrobium sp.]|jgi:hypothetical protein|nr:hypothetical protein [Rhizomicrobium sp.]
MAKGDVENIHRLAERSRDEMRRFREKSEKTQSVISKSMALIAWSRDALKYLDRLQRKLRG